MKETLGSPTSEHTSAAAQNPPVPNGTGDVFYRRTWFLAAMLFAISFGLFCLAAYDRVTKPSKDTHFVYLAQTFNSMIHDAIDPEFEGRKNKVAFELDRRPPHGNDWASYWEIKTKGGELVRGIWLDTTGEGRLKTLDGKVVYLRKTDQISPNRRRYFVSFPPGPALMMMPLVAIWDHGVNDILFTIFFASLNVMLLYLLLCRLSRSGVSGRSTRENLWLTLFFGFGSAHLWCSILGQVWFTALTVGVTWTLLYMLCTIDLRRPFLAGCCLAMAFATRTPLLFTAVFFYLFALFPEGRWRRSGWPKAIRDMASFSIVPMIVGLALLWTNAVRFESLTEFGHSYLAGGNLKRIQTYGLFNIQFLSKNLSAMWTLLPRFQPTEPYVIISKHGMSILLTTPLLIYVFRPSPRKKQTDVFWWRILWTTILVTALPALMYQNTGYEQFGYRFIMDYLPYLTVLLALNRTPMTWVYKLAILWGVAVNTFGAVTFKRFEFFYHNDFFL